MSFTPYDIPPQENKGKWFRSHLLGREIELGELYSLGSNDLDLLMAETAEIRSDLDFKEKNIGKFRTAGYFLELARIIEKRKLLESYLDGKFFFLEYGSHNSYLYIKDLNFLLFSNESNQFFIEGSK